MIEKLQKLLNDHQLYMSNLQHDAFIVRRAGGVTLYGQYKQSLRELYKRVRGIREIVCDLEIAKLDLAELKETDNRRSQVEAWRKIGQIEEIERNRDETMRELTHFYQISSALKAEIGELTDEKRDKLEHEMWEKKLLMMAHSDYVSHGRLDSDTLEFALSLDETMREKVLPLMKSPARLEKLVNELTSQSSRMYDALVDTELKLESLNDDLKSLIGG